MRKPGKAQDIPYPRAKNRTSILTLSVAIAAALLALPQAASAARVAAVQDAVRLIRPLPARVAPDYDARRIVRLEAHTPATLRTLVMPVVERRTTEDGREWVRVRLPRRPNGSTGWVPRRSTRVEPQPWRIQVSIGKRRATVYRSGRAVRRFPVVVGTRRTPTPLGHFFVVERLKLHKPWAPGVWALSTSGYSNVLRRFDGWNGQMALHGRGSLSAPLGTRGSNGCVRFADRHIRWLARKIPNGTPIDVTRR